MTQLELASFEQQEYAIHKWLAYAPDDVFDDIPKVYQGKALKGSLAKARMNHKAMGGGRSIVIHGPQVSKWRGIILHELVHLFGRQYMNHGWRFKYKLAELEHAEFDGVHSREGYAGCIGSAQANRADPYDSDDGYIDCPRR